MNLVFRPSTENDAIQLARSLRQADKDELAALSNRSHEMTLRISIQMCPEPITVLADDEIAAIFGVGYSSILSLIGIPWLLGSEVMNRLDKPLLSVSRAVIEHWRTKHQTMINYVSADHHQSIRWLKWLGFTVHPAEPYGDFGNLFHKFEMRS